MVQQPPLDATLVAQYDCSSVHRGFAGVLLSKTAFETAQREVGANRERQRRRHAVRLWQAESQRHRVQRADVDLHHVCIVADAQHFEERHRRQRRR